MTDKSLNEVHNFLTGLRPEMRQIVDALRAVIARIIPAASETVVWGALSYHRPWIGGRVKGAVCQIVTKPGAVRLDFIHGAELKDSYGLLQGTRLAKRFVPIRSVADAERPEVADLIRRAAAWEPKSGA
jgi:hypothetical protein